MAPLTILNISTTTGGGSGRSQRDLARELAALGHEVAFLVDSRSRSPLRRFFFEQLSDLSVKIEGSRLGRTALWLATRVGRRTKTMHLDGIEHRTSPFPANAFDGVVADVRPDVVVATSLKRWEWRLVNDRCRALGIPTVLYLREEESLEHASASQPDMLVANAQSLADAMRQRGFECAFVPSVTNVDVTRTESTRCVALSINPIASRGVDTVYAIAAELPEIEFILQESWPLDDDAIAAIREATAHLPNVKLRRQKPPGPGLYGDARVVIVPYRIDNRPRVILEAQSNGIPVVVGPVPALVEAVGSGGIVLDADTTDAWIGALRRLWDDDDEYERLCTAASEHGARAEVDPTIVARSFVDLVAPLVGAAEA